MESLMGSKRDTGIDSYLRITVVEEAVLHRIDFDKFESGWISVRYKPFSYNSPYLKCISHKPHVGV